MRGDQPQIGSIARIATAMVSTSLPADFRIAHGTDARRRDHVLVRITATDGSEGFGESSPLTYFTGETAESTRALIDHHLAPMTVGTSVTRLGPLHRMWNQAFPGNAAAKCAIDLALHDLLGRCLGLPVVDLLGGSVTDRLPVYKAIGFGLPYAVVFEAERLWDLGIRAFKLKVGEGIDADLAKLNALRERFGSDVQIIIDGNGGYTPQNAVRLLRKADPFDIAYIEQPVPGEDIEGLTFVRAHGGVPVMADESLHTVRDAQRLLAAGAVDLLGLKLIKTGGLWPARQIAGLAEAVGVTCVVISPFDTQLGVAAAAHLAATFPQPLAGQGLGTFLVTDGEPVRHLTVENGELIMPTEAGLGITPDPALFDGLKGGTWSGNDLCQV
jgi:L-alanine-DL-glutamate epimerase-like enolase superfamily enzyme